MHVSHEDGATEAHITAFAEGNTEAWTAAAGLGDKLKVLDTVIQMSAVEVLLATPSLYYPRFSDDIVTHSVIIDWLQAHISCFRMQLRSWHFGPQSLQQTHQ